MAPDNELQAWVARRRAESGLRVEPVRLDDCREWALSQGELRHATGRYFQVVGARVQGGPADGWEQPMLRQREVGLLGFVVRQDPDGSRHWLLQAKTEPGTIGGTHVGPTVQATRSNFERVHGGAPTRYLEWFVHLDRSSLSDVVVSEQGTRFLGKLNRNRIVRVPAADAPPAGPGEGTWRWFPSAVLRSALGDDYLVNTDARSVLVTGPWHLLADDEPFAGGDGFRARLHASHRRTDSVERVLDLLDVARTAPRATTVEVPLTALDGWRVADRGVERVGGAGVEVVTVSVQVDDREVRSWCQPLLCAPEATVDLWCQERDGALGFAFRLSAEPGLRHLVELAPTNQSDLPDHDPLVAPAGSEVVVRSSVAQSDEGGRFLESVCRYRILEVLGEPVGDARGTVWLTLGEVEMLARRPATFTNEARSAISLLLAFV